MNIALYSYALSGLAFLVLAIVLLTSWRGRLQGGLLLLGVSASALWSVLALLATLDTLGGAPWIPVAEAIRYGAWLAFLFGILRSQSSTENFFRQGWIPKGLAYGIVITLAVVPVLPEQLAKHISVKAFYALNLILVIGSLWLVENLFRNTKPDQRWGIKFLCLGLGGMYVYDFVLYSHAVMFNQIDPLLWEARGIVNTLVVPLIAVTAARNPDWSLDVFVSRKMVYHTATLIGAGVYLLIMAATGYYIRAVGGQWGGVLQIAFIFAAGVLLATLLFSGHARARLRVFFNKHFFNYQYDYREEWLGFTHSLSACKHDREVRECVIRATASIVDSPAGVLWWCRAPGTLSPVAHWNMPYQSSWMIDVDSALILFLQDRQWVVDLLEWHENPENYNGLELPGWVSEINNAWLLVPLIDGGDLVGVICLAKPLANVNLNWEVMDLLKTAATQAASYLGQVEANQSLTEARQFEGFHRLSAYILHDLKNIIAQQSIITRNAAKHKHKPEFIEDAVGVMEHSVTKMNRLMNLLKSGFAENRPRITELNKLLESILRELSSYKPTPNFESNIESVEVIADPDRLRAALRNLIQNAQQATPDDGMVTVRVEQTDGYVRIAVIDNGCGMSQGFIQERLFKPFDTTKGDVGMGIGAYESREYVRSLGGDLIVNSKPGEGSKFEMLIPFSESGREQIA